jgi:uncharacterized SAM-dependent methyltransferase
MHLVSSRDQCISVRRAGCDVQLRKGETIWTESSYKYDLADVSQMAADAGFVVKGQWIDEEWPFAETLLLPEMAAGRAAIGANESLRA